jgi:alkylhydroperoxidase family enzyme
MLDLARRITRTGGAQADTELERARKAGLTDAQLVEVAAHVASKLFTNAVGIMSQVKVDLPAQPNLPTP